MSETLPLDPSEHLKAVKKAIQAFEDAHKFRTDRKILREQACYAFKEAKENLALADDAVSKSTDDVFAARRALMELIEPAKENGSSESILFSLSPHPDRARVPVDVDL
jgi:hypothetical protein